MGEMGEMGEMGGREQPAFLMLYTPLSQFGAGIFASRRAEERIRLPGLSESLNNQILSTIKKTLVALFALASIAMSAEFTSSSYLEAVGNVS